MKRILLTAALAIGAVSVPVTTANAQTYSATRQISSIDLGNLKAVLEERGGSVKQGEGDTLLIDLDNGLKAVAVFTACNDGPCRGLNIMAAFTPPADRSSAELAKLVADYNQQWSAGKAFVNDRGSPVVQGYMIFDGGVTMDNLRVQLGVFGGMAKKLQDILNENS